MNMGKRPSDIDVSKYSDDALSVEVPSYLRQQKGLLLFKAPKNASPDRCLSLVAVLNETAEVRRIALEGWPNNVFRKQEWMGIKTTPVRVGPVDWVKGGFEIFCQSTSNQVTVPMPWDYCIHFEIEPQLFVEARMGGHGDQANFEAACQRILSTVKRKAQ